LQKYNKLNGSTRKCGDINIQLGEENAVESYRCLRYDAVKSARDIIDETEVFQSKSEATSRMPLLEFHDWLYFLGLLKKGLRTLKKKVRGLMLILERILKAQFLFERRIFFYQLTTLRWLAKLIDNNLN
jgi:hypothetical protein